MRDTTAELLSGEKHTLLSKATVICGMLLQQLPTLAYACLK